jgi:hypothetical protein
VEIPFCPDRADTQRCCACAGEWPHQAAAPSFAEAARIASDMAMNDSLLQKGDIVVTDRGFSFFAGRLPMA